jgi:tetratricopeptide (TPR) repeat protein
VARCHPAVDTAYATLASLLGADAPWLAEVRQRLEKEENRRREYREHGLLGTPPADGATIDLELECLDCGDSNFYPVRKVLIDPDFSEAAPFIAGELTCLSCGRDSSLRLRGTAHLALTADLLKRKLASDQGQPYEGVVQFVKMTMEGGRRVVPAEAIAHYEALVERAPRSAAAWLGLGNCLANVDRNRRAASCFRRSLELEPECVEASLRLGEYLAEEGLRQEARDVLLDAYRLRGHWVFHHLAGLLPSELEQSVLEGLRALGAEVVPEASTVPSPPVPRVSRKVGRNEPCTCGSGKKFKKCCGQ